MLFCTIVVLCAHCVWCLILLSLIKCLNTLVIMFPSMASCLIITVYMELWKLRQSYLTALCNQQYCFVHVHMHSDVLSFVFYLLI